MRVVEQAGGLRRPAGRGAARGRRGVRQRRRVPRAIHPPRQAHRSADPRRPARQHRCTCTSATARCSAGIRRWSRSRPAVGLDPTHPRRSCATPRCTLAQRRRLRQRRHRRVPGRRRHRRVVLHRGEPAHPGGAHGHRDGHRHRPRARQILIAQGHELHGPEMSLPHAGRDAAARLRAPVPHHHRGSGEQASSPTTAGSTPIARRPASASGSTAASAYGGAVITPFYDSLLVKVTAWGREFRARLPAHGPRAARVPHPRREDQHPVPRERGQPPELPDGRGDDHACSTTRRSCSSSRRARDRATKLLTYLGDVIVNGNPQVAGQAAVRSASASRPCRQHDPGRAARRHAPAAAASSGPRSSPSGRASRSGC